MIDQIYSGSLFEIKKYFGREMHENLDLDPEEHKKCQCDGLKSACRNSFPVGTLHKEKTDHEMQAEREGRGSFMHSKHL